MIKSDYTRGANLIGPATALLEKEVQQGGKLSLEREGREAQELLLPAFFTGRRLVIVSQPGLTILFDANSDLDNPGVLGFVLEGKHTGDILLFWPDQLTGRINVTEGRGSGAWSASITQNGTKRNPESVVDPIDLVYGNFLRIMVDRPEKIIGFHFLANLQNRPFFSNDFLDKVRHIEQMNRVEMWYNPNTGVFIRAKLIGQDRETLQLIQELEIPDFPLRWPSKPRERVKVYTAPREKLKVDGPEGAPKPRPTAVRRAAPGPRGFSAPPRMASTTQLAIQEMIAELEKHEVHEHADPWTEIESNLELLEPQRAFKLVSKYPELIGEKTTDWPRYKLREIFGELPGPSLMLLFNNWTLDHAIALAHDHPDRKALIDYLRDSEVDRLMSKRGIKEITTKAEARQLLGIGPQSSERDIKRVWRMLLGWMNADFGRRNERAIHQKKDEIAKHLNKARDILIR